MARQILSPRRLSRLVNISAMGVEFGLQFMAFLSINPYEFWQIARQLAN
jgi:hypothetical protein